jgi:hypothetical protein
MDWEGNARVVWVEEDEGVHHVWAKRFTPASVGRPR